MPASTRPAARLRSVPASLTQELCRSAKKVIAIEVDRSLRPVLAETMAGNENLEIIFGDVLKTDVRALVAEEFAGMRPVACANLPYYITTPILAALLESRAFESITVMVQKEVAQRIAAPAGKGDYGAFSVFCQYYAVRSFSARSRPRSHSGGKRC